MNTTATTSSQEYTMSAAATPCKPRRQLKSKDLSENFYEIIEEYRSFKTGTSTRQERLTLQPPVDAKSLYCPMNSPQKSSAVTGYESITCSAGRQ